MHLFKQVRSSIGSLGHSLGGLAGACKHTGKEANEMHLSEVLSIRVDLAADLAQ